MKHHTAHRAALSRRLTLVVLACSASWGALAQTPTIVMASTTSTEQSGLFPYLLPEFKKASGVQVKVVEPAPTLKA